MVDFKMPRIGQAMGWTESDAYKGFDRNRMALMQAFAGLGADPMNPTGGFTLGFANGAMLDQQNAEDAEKKAKEEQSKNATMEWLQSQGYTDLVEMAEATGDIGAAWTEGLKRGQPQAAKPPIEVGGVLVDPVTFQPVFDSRQPEKPPAPPSGYQWVEGGALAPIPGGPASIQSNKPPTEAERKATALTTVTQQDAALLFGDGTNPGIFDALGGTVDQSLQAGAFGLNPLAGLASSDYKVAKDAISNITQSYLYAMSGATAPPEEVKKISEQVTPQPLDSPEQKKAKRDRLLAMYQAIEGAQGNAAPGDGGWEVIGVQ